MKLEWICACVCVCVNQKKKKEIIEQETVRGKFIQKQHQHKYTRFIREKIRERKGKKITENLTYMNIFFGYIRRNVLKKK